MSAPPLLPATDCGTAAAILRRCFAEAGLDDPERDARRLLEAIAGITAAALLTDPRRPIGQSADALSAAMRRRLAHEPVSRIIGERAFFKHVFQISEATLDPRPETETVVEAALSLLADASRLHEPLRLLDIGVGSGCILLSLLAELPSAKGVGTDISAPALAMAAENARRLGLADRAEWKLVPASGPGVRPCYREIGRIDLLVSNPPYIPSGDIPRLQPEVRSYDPLAALDGGVDGLDMYRHIAGLVPEAVRDGWVVLEVGAGQAPDVSAILRELPGRTGDVRSWRDLGGIVRCVAAQIRSQPCRN